MEIPANLISQLEKQNILPFIGAGVSMEVKSRSNGERLFPSWRSVLIGAADRLDQEKKEPYAQLVRSLINIDNPNFLEAARYAQESLGPIWYDFLRSQFDHRRETAVDESLLLAESVWRLGSNLIVTTNYDRVLRWACPEQNDVGLWSISAPAEQAAILQGVLSRPVIWHLHGQIDDAANMILTPDGYNRIYPPDPAKNRFSVALETLRALLASRSFLFIGFSLTDTHFGLQLKAISDVFAGGTGPHYALIHEEKVQEVRDQKLPGIEIISYSGFGKPLLELVNQLGTHAPSTVRLPPTVTVPRKSYIPVVVTEQHEVIFDDSCDTPPPTTPWVGRMEELNLLRDLNSKVIAITGIGGQGKSTLAAKYLTELNEQGVFFDWRDCKEESNTLHTHIVRIIERITKGQRRASELALENSESVIKLFFNLTLSMRGVFVFDNIDQYVDVYKGKAVDSMHSFIEAANKAAGGSKFIFTARPKLLYEHSTYIQIELNGLTKKEAQLLFEARGLIVDSRDVDEVHEVTQGHPLWINLIAMQVLTNRVKLVDLLARIKAGKDAGLPNAMLHEIWKSLTTKHQKLLRYLAEMVRPETEKQIGQYVSKELNYHQFNKALRQLKALDLVVVKSPFNSPDTIELHPLLREFVRRQFSQSERSPYIATIILYVDQIIVRLRPNLAASTSYEVLQNWSAKVELLVNSGDYKQALNVLDETRRPLLRNGYAEEFVRLAISLFANLEFGDAIDGDQTLYDDAFKDLVIVLTQLGRFGEAEEFILKFEQTVAGATARFVALCQMRTWFFWYCKNMELAKEWGRRGVEVKTAGNLDTRHDCGHDLALAQRDSGEIAPALAFFLGSATIEEVVDPGTIDMGRGGSFYGNIGRTLYLGGTLVEARNCLIKSAWLLEKAHDELVLLNKGWAALWLGELTENDFPEMAYVFFRRAASKWKLVSPPRADDALEAISRIRGFIDPKLIACEDWEIDRKYVDWLNKHAKFQ